VRNCGKRHLQKEDRQAIKGAKKKIEIIADGMREKKILVCQR
jgi:hypothetical protein